MSLKSPVTNRLDEGGSGGSSAPATSGDQPLNIHVAQPVASQDGPIEGTFSFDFYETPVANTSALMIRPGLASASKWTSPFRGSIVGLAYASSTTLSAGTLSFGLQVNGTTVSGLSLDWDSGSSEGSSAFAKGTYSFAAGDTVQGGYTASSGYVGGEVVLTVFVVVTQTAVV